MKIAFGIGIVLVALAVLTSVAAAELNHTYFDPQHSSADTGKFQMVTLYYNVSDGATFEGCQIQLQFNASNVDIPDGYVLKGCPPVGDGEHCWEVLSTNHTYVPNGYMWFGVDGPQEAEWQAFPPPGAWVWNTIDHFTGPMQVKICDIYVVANATGTAGVSRFDFGFEHYPQDCPVCMACKFIDEHSDPTEFTHENGTFTHGGPFIYSCSDSGMVINSYNESNEKNAFVPGEKVYAEGFGLGHSTDYKIWIQDNPVNEGYSLVEGNCTNCTGKGDCPGKTGVANTSSAGGHFGPTMIWNISDTATITSDEYDIVADNQTGANVGTFNVTDDGIDSLSTEGFVAPVPEMLTIALFGMGLLMLAGYVHRRRRNR